MTKISYSGVASHSRDPPAAHLGRAPFAGIPIRARPRASCAMVDRAVTMRI